MGSTLRICISFFVVISLLNDVFVKVVRSNSKDNNKIYLNLLRNVCVMIYPFNIGPTFDRKFIQIIYAISSWNESNFFYVTLTSLRYEYKRSIFSSVHRLLIIICKLLLFTTFACLFELHYGFQCQVKE